MLSCLDAQHPPQYQAKIKKKSYLNTNESRLNVSLYFLILLSVINTFKELTNITSAPFVIGFTTPATVDMNFRPRSSGYFHNVYTVGYRI